MVAVIAFVMLWSALLTYRWPEDDWPRWFTTVVALMTALVYVGGPFGCYAVARVLRPHPPSTGTSRRLRHMLSALCTAYGLALLTAYLTSAERGVPLNTFGVFWLYVLLVPVLAPATVFWGLAQAMTRRRPVQAPSLT